MSDCSKHKRYVKKYNGTLKELAIEIGDLHYEELYKFVNELSNKIKLDGAKDYEGGRKNLASSLIYASEKLKEASKCLEHAWEISKPYMKNETT